MDATVVPGILVPCPQPMFSKFHFALQMEQEHTQELYTARFVYSNNEDPLVVAEMIRKIHNLDVEQRLAIIKWIVDVTGGQLSTAYRIETPPLRQYITGDPMQQDATIDPIQPVLVTPVMCNTTLASPVQLTLPLFGTSDEAWSVEDLDGTCKEDISASVRRMIDENIAAALDMPTLCTSCGHATDRRFAESLQAMIDRRVGVALDLRAPDQMSLLDTIHELVDVAVRTAVDNEIANLGNFPGHKNGRHTACSTFHCTTSRNDEVKHSHPHVTPDSAARSPLLLDHLGTLVQIEHGHLVNPLMGDPCRASSIEVIPHLTIAGESMLSPCHPLQDDVNETESFTETDTTSAFALSPEDLISRAYLPSPPRMPSLPHFNHPYFPHGETTLEESVFPVGPRPSPASASADRSRCLGISGSSATLLNGVTSALNSVGNLRRPSSEGEPLPRPSYTPPLLETCYENAFESFPSPSVPDITVHSADGAFPSTNSPPSPPLRAQEPALTERLCTPTQNNPHLDSGIHLLAMAVDHLEHVKTFRSRASTAPRGTSRTPAGSVCRVRKDIVRKSAFRR